MQKPKATELELAFHRRMHQVADEAQEKYDYAATRFRQTIEQKGARRAAKDWLAERTPQSGFTTLFERGGTAALRISMEGVIVFEPQWRELFTSEEIAEATRRLKEHGVTVPETTLAP